MNAMGPAVVKSERPGRDSCVLRDAVGVPDRPKGVVVWDEEGRRIASRRTGMSSVECSRGTSMR